MFLHFLFTIKNEKINKNGVLLKVGKLFNNDSYMEITSNSNATNLTNNANTIWSEAIDLIKEHISENSFNTWLSNVYPLKIDENTKTLVLGVPNELTRGWIQRNYIKVLTTEIMKIRPHLRNIKLTISRRTTLKSAHKKSADYSKNIAFELAPLDQKTNLNPNLNFDNFVIAPYNRFAYTAAQTIMEKFGVLYNPFYVYGPTGVGKTHLLQAIGNKLGQRNPSMSICYMSTETFLEQYIGAIKNDRVKEFRKEYSSYQLFILDDVHFLQRSESALVEMFHMFNTLINKNAQIILSSDKPPAALSEIEERIKTRLNSGVVIDIKQPEFEDMRIVCDELSKGMDINLTPDAVEYIVENVSQNIREINGALKNIHLHTIESRGSSVDINDVKKFVKNHIKIKNNISCDDVVDSVCSFYHIKRDLLSTKIRKREIVHARQVSMFIFREHLGMSYSFIGRHFGNRDHTTVIHACEKIEKQLQTNNKTQRDLEQIKKSISI